MASEQDDWELSKENVQPLRQGRNISRLTAALQPETDLRQQKQEFEAELRTYSSDDPLDVWHRYMQWIEQNYPKGGKESNLADLLERCLRTFYNVQHYKNDQRFVTAWIKYADFCKEPLEIFNFMKDQGIGVDLACFYQAWAWTNEQIGNSKKSDLIFQEGIRRSAQPLDVLERRHKEFQMRMMREGMSGPVTPEPAGQVEDQRAVLGRLRPEGQKKKAPVQRIGHAKMSSRGGLKMLGLAPQQVQGQKFTVFNDENATSSLPGEVGDWSEMPTQASLHKENTKKAGVWTKAKLGHKGGVVPVRSVGSNKPAFTIHVEEGADQSMATPRKTLEIGNPVLSARKPDKYVDPLLHMRQTEDCKEKLMCCVDKIQCGTEEYSFEELRAARWRARRKQEVEKKRLEEQQKQILSECREEMQRSRDTLKEKAERIKQEQIALRQEQEAMILHCRQQILIQQEQFNKERQIQLQRQQEMLEQDIQKRMSFQLNNSGSSNIQESRTLVSNNLQSGSPTSIDQTEPGGVSNSSLETHLGLSTHVHDKPISRKREAGAMKQLVFNDSKSLKDKAESPRNHSTSPCLSSHRDKSSSNEQNVSTSSPIVNTRETMQLVKGLFDASLDIERQLDWSDNLSPQTNITAGQGSKGTTTQSAPSKPSSGLPFTIYDESQETEHCGK